MSCTWNNLGLPFLPGYTFQDVTKSAFHRPQTLSYRNGYPMPRCASVSISREPLLTEQLTRQEISEDAFETPDITYDLFEQTVYEDLIPAYVALDKKVLHFYAYFMEAILYSPEEEYRVRFVKIYYYLVDDSICIIEPKVENSGIPQGTRLKRQRLPKNERGEDYHWKDLNLGMDLEVYGVKYHITHCDAFTKKFMESEGIILNDPEPIPVDPYSKRRKKPQPCYTTPSTFDKSFPSCVMEVSEEEVDEYYSPKDFQVGQEIKLLGCNFLLYDCDGFTKEYYQKNHPDMEMKFTEIPKKVDVPQDRKKVIPPYNGFGSLEDSLQNCFHVIPQRPKQNVIKKLEDSHKVLRYSAILDSQYPEDEGRHFILSYFLSDEMIRIFEKHKHNSGFMGGMFLEKTHVLKPGSTMDNPVYYSPADFAIGTTVEVFGHRFVLTNADHYVLKYLESNLSNIPCQTLDSLRQKLGVKITNNQPADQDGNV